MTIGKRIQKLRMDRKENQADLAVITGKKQSNISKIERDEVKPTIDVIEVLCKHYNVTSDYLIFGKTENRPVDDRFNYLNVDEWEIIESILERAKKRHDTEKSQD